MSLRHKITNKEYEFVFIENKLKHFKLGKLIISEPAYKLKNWKNVWKNSYKEIVDWRLDRIKNCFLYALEEVWDLLKTFGGLLFCIILPIIYPLLCVTTLFWITNKKDLPNVIE